MAEDNKKMSADELMALLAAGQVAQGDVTASGAPTPIEQIQTVQPGETVSAQLNSELQQRLADVGVPIGQHPVVYSKSAADLIAQLPQSAAPGGQIATGVQTVAPTSVVTAPAYTGPQPQQGAGVMVRSVPGPALNTTVKRPVVDAQTAELQSRALDLTLQAQAAGMIRKRAQEEQQIAALDQLAAEQRRIADQLDAEQIQISKNVDRRMQQIDQLRMQAAASPVMTPSEIWENRGALSQILSAIAIGLDSATSRYLGRPETVANMLIGQVNQEAQAQVQRRQSILGLEQSAVNAMDQYTRQVGSPQEKLALRRDMLLKSVQTQLQAAAQRMGSQFAGATADEISRQLEAARAQGYADLRMKDMGEETVSYGPGVRDQMTGQVTMVAPDLLRGITGGQVVSSGGRREYRDVQNVPGISEGQPDQTVQSVKTETTHGSGGGQGRGAVAVSSAKQDARHQMYAQRVNAAQQIIDSGTEDVMTEGGLQSLATLNSPDIPFAKKEAARKAFGEVQHDIKSRTVRVNGKLYTADTPAATTTIQKSLNDIDTAANNLQKILKLNQELSGAGLWDSLTDIQRRAKVDEIHGLATPVIGMMTQMTGAGAPSGSEKADYESAVGATGWAGRTFIPGTVDQIRMTQHMISMVDHIRKLQTDQLQQMTPGQQMIYNGNALAPQQQNDEDQQQQTSQSLRTKGAATVGLAPRGGFK